MSQAHGSLKGKLSALKGAMTAACDENIFQNAVIRVNVGSKNWLTLSYVDGQESHDGHDRLFDIASKTKALIAIMVHAMVKMGTISLDSTVGEVFASTKRKVSQSVATLTIRQLLVHSAYFHLPTSLKQLAGDDIIRAILESEAETGVFAYTNNCYLLLGALLESRTGKNLQDLYTSLFSGRVCTEGLYWSRHIPAPLISKVVPTTADPKANLMPHDPTSRNLQQGYSLSGAAGVFTSAPMLAGFFKTVLWGNGGIIADESRAMLRVNAVRDFRREHGSKDPTSPEFAEFGMNMDIRGGRVHNWPTGHTGCEGLIIDELAMVAVLLTDAVRWGDESRKAVRGFFRKTVAGILIP